MDLTLTRDTLYLRPYPRHRKAMLSVASHPVYKVLDSVTPLGDQAVLSHPLLVSTTNQPITVSTTVLLLMCYISTAVPTHGDTRYIIITNYIPLYTSYSTIDIFYFNIHIRAFYQFAYV